MDQSNVEECTFKCKLGICGSLNGVIELATSMLKFNVPTPNFRFYLYTLLECIFSIVVLPTLTTCPNLEKCSFKALLL